MMKVAIEAFSKNYRHGTRLADHHHDLDQLLYAACGTMTVTTDSGIWVIPPQRGVWIPAGISHRISMSGTVQMRTLYLAPGLAFDGSANCRVLGIAPLEREIILELVRTPIDDRDSGWNSLVDVLLQRLHSRPEAPLHLPWPRDPRARRVAQALTEDPARREGLSLLAKDCGASGRTVARLFSLETGMTFGRWRQQARILAALPLLASGRSVGNVAFDVGYESPSAFIAMFRQRLGVPPGRYFGQSDLD